MPRSRPRPAFFQECPHCGAEVRFAGYLRLKTAQYGTVYGQPLKVRFHKRWVRVSWRECDFATCPSCHEAVSA